MKKIQKIFLILPLIQILLANQAKAAGLITCSGRNCTLCDLFATLKNVVDFVFELFIVGAIVYILYHGFMILISAGDPGKVKKARTSIIQVLIGLAIAFGAWVIVDIFIKFLFSADTLKDMLPWNQIQC